MPYASHAVKLERQAAYRAAHRAELAEKERSRHQANPHARDGANRAYLEARPHLRRAIAYANRSNQRAAKLGAPGKLYGREVVLIDGPCAYGGGDAIGWDHAIALSRGGANEIGNIVRCCTDCNRRKFTKPKESFR